MLCDSILVFTLLVIFTQERARTQEAHTLVETYSNKYRHCITPVRVYSIFFKNGISAITFQTLPQRRYIPEYELHTAAIQLEDKLKLSLERECDRLWQNVSQFQEIKVRFEVKIRLHFQAAVLENRKLQVMRSKNELDK